MYEEEEGEEVSMRGLASRGIQFVNIKLDFAVNCDMFWFKQQKAIS